MIANKRVLFFVGLWLFYTITQMKGLSWFDSGELALVGSQLGIGHPPGQPLYTLLCYLCYLLSPQSAIPLMVQLSVISSVLSLLALLKLSEIRLFSHFPENTFTPKSLLQETLSPIPTQQESIPPMLLCGITMIVGFQYVIWDHSTRLELYMLASCLLLFGLYFGLKAIEQQKVPYAGALLIGFTSAVNPLFALALLLSLLCLGLLQKYPFRFYLKAFTQSFLLAFIGLLLPYLYFFDTLAQDRQGLSNPWIWGNFQGVQDLFNFLKGTDYGNNGLNHLSALPKNITALFFYLLESKQLLFVILGLLGSYRIKGLFLVQGLCFMSCGIFPLLYQRYDPSIPDFQGYLLPNYLLLGLGILKGLQGQWLQAQGLIFKKALIVLLAFIAFISGTADGVWDSIRQKWYRGQDHLATDINQAILTDLPANAIVIVGADHVVFNLLYAQRVLQQRKDLKLLVLGYLNSSWFWRDLYQTHPELVQISPQAYPNDLQRLYALIQHNPAPIYLESLSMAHSLGFSACLDGWMVQAGCQRLPKAFDFQAWFKQNPSILLDPSHRSVLAWWGSHLSFSLWQEQKALSSIRLLQAFQFKKDGLLKQQGLQASEQEEKKYFWAAHPRLWQNENQPLIGEFEYLGVIEEILKNKPSQ